MIRIILISILVFVSKIIFAQGIDPNQIQPSPYKNGILRAVDKVFDEWVGDSVYYYKHDTLSLIDTMYITQDSILCWQKDRIVYCDTIRFDVGPGTDTSGYNLDFRISNDTLYIRDANDELYVVLPEGAVDTDDQTLSISNDTLYIADGNSVDLAPYMDDTDRQKVDTFQLYDGNKIRLSLDRDNEIYKSITLPVFVDSVYIVQDSIICFDINEITKCDTIDLKDYQTLSIDSTATTIGITISNGNRIHFDADQSKWTRSGSDLYNKVQTDSIGINTTNPGKTLDVNGEVRVRDLTTGGARTLIGEIGDGTLQSVNVGHGLQLNSSDNTLRNNVRDSTSLNSGYGIYAYENIANNWTIEADTNEVVTPYDLTQLNFESMDSLYNGNRAISRVPAAGQNLNATTFRQWLDWWYIGNYTQPSISLGSLSTPVEVGTSTGYTLSGSTSNPCSFTLSNGTVNGNNFGSSTSYSYSYTHAPTSHGTTTITAQQSWDQTGTICQTSTPTTGTTSASRSINNVYPVFYGMSATSYTSGSVPYTEFTKRVVTEASLSSLTMTGTNKYIYILIPKSWTDYTVSSIIDHNGFNVTGSFTAYDVSVTSTGLTNNWTYNYKLYKLNNLTTASGYNYTYNR